LCGQYLLEKRIKGEVLSERGVRQERRPPRTYSAEICDVASVYPINKAPYTTYYIRYGHA
jgi:hypothetical protein